MDTFINYTSPELMRVFCYDKDGYDLKGVNKDGYCRNGEKWEDIDEQIYPQKKVIRRTLSPANDAGECSEDFPYLNVELSEFLTPHVEKSNICPENASCHYLYALQESANMSDWFRDSRDFSYVKLHDKVRIATSPVLVVSMDARYNMVYVKASPEHPIFVSEDFGMFDYKENDLLSIEYLMYCIRKMVMNSCAVHLEPTERKTWVSKMEICFFLETPISFPVGENSIIFQQRIVDMAKNDRIALPEGTLLNSNRYRVRSILGMGAFGITYLASDTISDTDVVIKEFFPQLLAYRNADCSLTSVHAGKAKVHYDNAKAKFIGESRKLMRFSGCPNIVQILDTFEDNRTHYYVMEYVKGRSLDQIQKELPNKMFPPQMAVDYIIQVGEALTEMHKQKVTHLDIKPQNILLTDNNRVILVDFGGAKEYDYIGKETSAHGNVRTLGYASPEQIVRPTQFSPKSDVFSLAMTLYKMLWNTLPRYHGNRLSYQIRDFARCSNFNDNGLFNSLLKYALSRALVVDLKSRCTLKEFMAILNNAIYLTSTR